MAERFDFVMVGGGIVGMATAWQLQSAAPGASVAEHIVERLIGA